MGRRYSQRKEACVIINQSDQINLTDVLFINDMRSVVLDNTTLALFADDAKCFRTIRSPLDCAQFQRDIDTLVEWSYAWKLAFNFDKC